MVKKGVAVVAVGGNSLIKDEKHKTIPDQYEAGRESMRHIVDMIEQGWEVVVTHGNGPQVGFILRRSELSINELHPVPLDFCGADSQGSIGYMFAMALDNEFKDRGMHKQTAAVVTQTIVDRNDKAFQNPSKPIGSFMDEKTAKEHALKDGWTVVEDAGRGWRRVVPSPIPQRIVEADAIKKLIEAGFTVVGVGGGGIPVQQGGRFLGFDSVGIQQRQNQSSGAAANRADGDALPGQTGEQFHGRTAVKDQQRLMGNAAERDQLAGPARSTGKERESSRPPQGGESELRLFPGFHPGLFSLSPPGRECIRP